MLYQVKRMSFYILSAQGHLLVVTLCQNSKLNFIVWKKKSKIQSDLCFQGSRSFRTKMFNLTWIIHLLHTAVAINRWHSVINNSLPTGESKAEATSTKTHKYKWTWSLLSEKWNRLVTHPHSLLWIPSIPNPPLELQYSAQLSQFSEAS